jgi:hypothetical protein
VQFSRELRDGITAGDITVSIRLWRRRQVKVGGRYPVGFATIEIDDIEPMAFGDVTATDVERSGEPDRETLRNRAAHAGPIDDDTVVHRIEFHLVS